MHEEGRGRERRERRRRRRRCSQIRHKRPRTHQERRKGFPAMTKTSRDTQARRKGKERKEEERTGSGQVFPARASVQRHTKEGLCLSVTFRKTPNGKGRGRKGVKVPPGSNETSKIALAALVTLCHAKVAGDLTPLWSKACQNGGQEPTLSAADSLVPGAGRQTPVQRVHRGHSAGSPWALTTRDTHVEMHADPNATCHTPT